MQSYNNSFNAPGLLRCSQSNIWQCSGLFGTTGEACIFQACLVLGREIFANSDVKGPRETRGRREGELSNYRFLLPLLPLLFFAELVGVEDSGYCSQLIVRAIIYSLCRQFRVHVD